jgi:hypothetical protein
MATLSENTPVYTTRKTAEEAANEMKEETKKEMEKLKELMKNHVTSTESAKSNVYASDVNYEELFLEDSDASSLSSEESEGTKDILKQISRSIKNNDSIKKKNKKQIIKPVDSKYGVIDSAVKVEKLRSEISKLESRIRYKDLDMVNLMHTQNELNVIVNKYKLFEEILNDVQIKEVKVSDLRNTIKNIISLDSNKIILHQLNQLDINNKVLNTEINNETIDEKLTKINNHNFSRLILSRRDFILNDFENLTNHIIYIKKDIINRQYIKDIVLKISLGCALIGILVYMLYTYI